MFLLPTLNRPELLKKCLQSAKAKCFMHPIMILIHEEDPSLEVVKNMELLSGCELKITKGITMAEKVKEVFDPGWRFVGIINDDFEFNTPDAGDKLLAYLDGKNFVSSNDRNIRSFMKPSGVTVWSMPLLKAIGWNSFFPPGLNHLFIDDVWLHIGNATGSWRLAADVIVDHNHVLDGKMQPDATFHKTYDDFFAGKSKDKDVFELFMKHDFGDVVTKILNFQDYLPGEQHNPRVYDRPRED